MIFEEYDKLNDYFNDLKPNLLNVSATTIIPAYNFYYSFYLLDTSKKLKKKQKQKVLKKVKIKLKKLKKWGDHCPDNYLHRYQLIKAELLKIEGDNNQAMYFYKKAIENANKSGLIHEEAFI